jgi:putative nucleotide binding protein
MEEYGYVLDYLPLGKPNEVKRDPIIQLVGEKDYTLLEVRAKKDPDVMITVGERIYIGKGKRDKVDRILRKISYEDLSETAKENLNLILEKIVKAKEDYFVEFINKAGPVSVRVHKLELLPGIGKKHLRDIIEERNKRPFTSFQDMKERIKNLPDPTYIFVNRIIEEMRGKSKQIFFVRWMTRRRGP